MSDANRCIAGQAFKFAFIAEASGSSAPQLSPTLTAADFRISTNGGTLAALANTPTNTPSGSAWVEVILAAAETTAAAAGGLVRFQAIDAAGNEWKYWGCLIPVFADEQAVAGSAMTLADGAITSNKIATDAINANALAASAVTEIQSGLATPTNITAGTITTVTNLTNAPTAGDLTATMKASVTTAAAAATPTVTVGTNSDKTGYSLSSNQSGVTVGTINALGAQAKADVNAELVDALNVDMYAEPASVPAATSTLVAKIQWLFTLARNKMTQTNTTTTLRNDADSTTIATSTNSDDGSTFTRGEWS